MLPNHARRSRRDTATAPSQPAPVALSTIWVVAAIVLSGPCLIAAQQDGTTPQPSEPVNGTTLRNRTSFSDGRAVPDAGEQPTTNRRDDSCTPAAEVLRDLDFLSLTYQAIQAAGLLTAFSGDGPPVTLLAPTNQGFEQAARQLGYASVQDLLLDTPLLRRLLEQHLLAQVLDVNNLQQRQVVQTLDFGNPIVIRTSPTGGVQFLGTGGQALKLRINLDYTVCEMGIVLIDNVLIPADALLLRNAMMNGNNDPDPRSSMNGSGAILVRQLDESASSAVQTTQELEAANGTSATTVGDNAAGVPRNRALETIEENEQLQTERDSGAADSTQSQADEQLQTERDSGTAGSAQTRAQGTTASTTLDTVDYDLEEFSVDRPGGPARVPMIGIRVPPLVEPRSGPVPMDPDGTAAAESGMATTGLLDGASALDAPNSDDTREAESAMPQEFELPDRIDWDYYFGY
mmetsp:Transcript_8210/g.23577  ORF Transcript_8210/g.23577 Transcript_8210/m.23577 type:complete len:460 (+) Transcript_8210:427-1806(+)|eukprot:CAMPEP_0117652100 /NCGR_PEP_ID=MMETSP0804-20121206/2448_1 /TAXON_ID=1074897 /ORGANISM="Tetraselmis astigmatica, Strain CCMP880" /LENGTH=459 /DNA_ID=CAMNT_0005458127 /DNA_START=409 /DNA_END=1788 /DNA_ORIENTATION=-